MTAPQISTNKPSSTNKLSDYQSGTGDGVITPDGCAVDVYALLPAGREPEVIHGAIPAGASILELGSGAGRVTNPLVALGHPVVALDESAEMLAHVRGAETVCAGIEGLDLGRRFDAVVLGSHLVNTPDEGQRREFLAACARHVAADGVVLVEQAPELFFAGLVPTRIQQGDLATTFRNIRRPRPDLLGMTIDYRKGDRWWSQTILCQRFDPAMLAEVGLRYVAPLTDDGAWFAARPA